MQVLVVDTPDVGLPQGTTDVLREFGWQVRAASNYRDAVSATGDGPIDAVVLSDARVASAQGEERAAFDNLLRILDGRRIATVLLTDRPARSPSPTGSLIEPVQRNISAAELRGRLAIIERYQGMIKRMERELANMQALGKRLNRHFLEMDQEMRLAGRLQRDFLPDLSRPMGKLQFAAIYRPVTWVSGDIFDVFRVDQDLTAFYVVDAVGHGLAASLLTMYIKRAIVSKRTEGGRHEVLTPSETIAALNNVLTEESLPNCQFVTACYAVLNHRTLSFEYARGGHPYPILITHDGIVSDLKTHGGLLGIFAGEDFPTSRTQLHPGDKVILYTDGVELAFQSGGGDAPAHTTFHSVLEANASLPIAELLQRLESQLDEQTGSLEPRDDVTVVGVEVLGAP